MDESLPAESDVTIIGGGVMGTVTAFFLTTQTDLSVTLLEKDTIAAGSTSDSAAILRHHYGPQEHYSRMAWWSHQFYREFEEQTGQPLAYGTNNLVRFASDGGDGAAYIEAGYEVLSSLDIPVSRYESSEFADRYPMLELDEFDFAVSDDEAAYSDGTDAATGFARAAGEEGASILTGITVEAIETTDGMVTGVQTDEGRVASEVVVVAAGPWTSRLAEPLGVDIPIRPTRENVVILDPPAEYREKYPELTPTTALSGGEWYMRPDFGDRILVATHHTGEEVDPDNYDQEPDEERLLDLTDRLAETVPELGDAGIQGQYCGVYSTTPDHDFVIDELGAANCYFACGFSGHGFKQAPAVGKILTDLITTGDTDLVDVDFFSLDRFADDPHGHGLPEDLA